MIINRTQDNDATGSDGYLTPLAWRESSPQPYHPPRYSDGKLICIIKRDIFNNLKSEYGHVCIIREDILVWSYRRSDGEWIAFGKDESGNIGKVYLCVKKHSMLWNNKDVRWDIVRLLGFRLESESNILEPNKGNFIVRFRFPHQMIELSMTNNRYNWFSALRNSNGEGPWDWALH